MKSKTIKLKAFTNAEIIALNITGKLNTNDVNDLKLTQRVVNETLQTLHDYGYLKHDIKEYY